MQTWGYPSGSDGKESACNAGDWGSIPGSGRSPREGSDYLLQYSGLQNSMDRGAWQTVANMGIIPLFPQLYVIKKIVLKVYLKKWVHVTNTAVRYSKNSVAV